MKQFCLAFLAASSLLHAANPFVGRWDITITTPKDSYPDWMELIEKDGKLDGRIQPRGGAVRPIASATMNGSRLSVTQSGTPGGHMGPCGRRRKLSGTQKRGDTDGESAASVPEARPKMPKAWTKPEPLFNGKDLTGWQPCEESARNSHWVVKDGVSGQRSKGREHSDQQNFQDFKLHIEVNCPDTATAASICAAAMKSRWVPKAASCRAMRWAPSTATIAPATRCPWMPANGRPSI